MSAKLEHCPECGGGWPPGPDYSLRGCGWLQGLERRISPSNSDVRIHDGAGGRDRFLHLELKGPRETWPLQTGQLIDLTALGRQTNWTVRVLRGKASKIDFYRVGASGLEAPPVRTHGEAVRRAVNLWLRGAPWREAEAAIVDGPEAKHVCGWARVDGLWTCVGDHYAEGLAEQGSTACGATLPQYP
jgi:hypothetical protein